MLIATLFTQQWKKIFSFLFSYSNYKMIHGLACGVENLLRLGITNFLKKGNFGVFWEGGGGWKGSGGTITQNSMISLIFRLWIILTVTLEWDHRPTLIILLLFCWQLKYTESHSTFYLGRSSLKWVFFSQYFWLFIQKFFNVASQLMQFFLKSRNVYIQIL